MEMENERTESNGDQEMIASDEGTLVLVKLLISSIIGNQYREKRQNDRNLGRSSVLQRP